MQGVNTIVLPQPTIYLILLLKEGIKIHENSEGFSWDRPTAYPNLKLLCLSFTLPIGKEILVLLEIRTLLFFPKIRTDENNLILMCLL